MQKLFEKLSLEDLPDEACVSCRGFERASISHFPAEPLHFFDEVKEIGTMTHWIDSDKFELGRKQSAPHLKKDLGLFTITKKLAKTNSYVGHDLLEHYDDFQPLTPNQLEDMSGVFEFLNKWEGDHGKPYSSGSDFTIVCSRHNLIDLIMAPFSDEDVHFNVKYINGYLHIFPDKQFQKKDDGIYSSESNIRRICYTGFELEDLVTETQPGAPKSAFYSLVQGKISKNIKLLFKAEMDCFNPAKRSYTEIKCTTGLKVKSAFHRRKLLRMWVQTSLVPSTDLLIGLRDPYYHQLSSFECYTRQELYQKFNNRNLSLLKKKYNYNANISVQWFRHLVKRLCQTITPYVEKTPTEAVSFKLTLTKQLELRLRKIETPSTAKESPKPKPAHAQS
ncbi:Dxo1p [Lachancea thermotolerans CBS 6340]|uniref:Decapping nuclease n=1 Tax=Lachancea thermotolerans (strain ATCC 56472 / CBS 6340 / NRRL Y-8284) TaxID=559295 RepID=C5DJF5_LACTC|nr:KLTH0F15994p [Lachancea thermotolerans CBS 6340]CAR24444.1 KLTH0F15994p [Lachancea thermotolerans CBS 6340]